MDLVYDVLLRYHSNSAAACATCNRLWNKNEFCAGTGTLTNVLQLQHQLNCSISCTPAAVACSSTKSGLPARFARIPLLRE
jgi:coenzyme F420-reducing hydrogenase gamma subunit